MHTPSPSLVRKRGRCYSLNNTMPKQDESGDVRRGSRESVLHSKSQRCSCCVSLLHAWWLLVKQVEVNIKKKERVVLRNNTYPLGECFSCCVSCVCSALVLFHLPHLSPFRHSTIWQNNPVLPPFSSEWGDDLLIDVIVKKEMDPDKMLCVWFPLWIFSRVGRKK